MALLGTGQIGRRVIELLRSFALRVIVFDPFLTADEAGQLGITKVSLEAAFSRAGVVSNHLADLPATKGMLTGAHFRHCRVEQPAGVLGRQERHTLPFDGRHIHRRGGNRSHLPPNIIFGKRENRVEYPQEAVASLQSQLSAGAQVRQLLDPVENFFWGNAVGETAGR